MSLTEKLHTYPELHADQYVWMLSEKSLFIGPSVRRRLHPVFTLETDCRDVLTQLIIYHHHTERLRELRVIVGMLVLNIMCGIRLMDMHVSGLNPAIGLN